MKSIKPILLGLAMTCISIASFAQTTISGTILDETTNSPLQFANVSVPLTTEGTTTDVQGKFSFEVPANTDTLVVSYIGYQQRYVSLSPDQKTVKATLSPSALTLNQAVVTANRETQKRSDVPIAISTIGAKEIKETNATQLDQLLNRIPSVNMIDLGNEQHSMSIRQPIATNGIYLYMEDGIPIRPTGAFNHNALIEIDQASLQRVEVVRGPVSALYGAEAIGGAINFFNSQPTVDPSGRIALQGNTIGFRRADASYSNTFNKFGIYAGASYSGRRNGFRDNSDYDKLSFNAKGTYAMNSRTRLSAGFTLIDYTTDALVGADSASFFNRRFPSQYEFAGRDVYALRANAGVEHDWNEKNKTNFRVYFRDNYVDQNATHTISNDPNDPLRASSEISRLAFTSYGTMVRHTANFDFLNSNLIAGASFDFSPTEVRNNYIDVTRNEFGDYVSFTNPDSLTANSEANLINSAAYLQYTVSPTEKLKVSVSGRFDNIVYDYDNKLGAEAASGAPDSRESFQNFTPKIGLVYNFKPNFGAYANYSAGFLPPQISDLYRNVKIPTLKAATFNNYEMGAWYQFSSKASIEVNVYQLDGTNEIINVDLPDGSREKQNAGETTHMGIEYTLTYQPSSQWTFRFSGSNARHEFVEYVDGDVNRKGNEMPFSPDWLANSSLTYYPTKLPGFRVGLEWMHVGEYFIDNANTNTYEGYDIFNLRTGYKYKKFEVWMNVMNLTDALYSVNTTLTGNERSYRVGQIRSFDLGVAYNF